MIRDFSPIAVPKVLPNPTRICPSLLEPARVQPDYEAMDETATHAVAMARQRELLRTLTQLCFVIRTGGDVLKACEGAEAVIGKRGVSHG
jgi:hypothetical protein